MHLRLLFLIFGLSCSSLAQARLARTSADLLQPQAETVVRLKDARLVRVHYDRLRRDFPRLVGKSEGEIDAMLLDCAAFISVPQTKQQEVNTSIPTLPQFIQAWRPLAYGRGLVFECFGGLIDGKGAGHRVSPRQRPYETGLLGLGEGFREDLLESVVSLIFQHEGYAPGTVETYAEMDLGFDMIHEGGHRERAGMYLRQAKIRAPDRPAGLSARDHLGEPIEAMLRKFGMTSDYLLATTDWQTLDHHNVQLDADLSLFDLGAMLVMRDFSYSPVAVDADLRLPFERWGYSRSNAPEPRLDNVRLWGNELGQRWVRGEVSRAQIDSEFEDWLAPLKELWRPCASSLAP